MRAGAVRWGEDGARGTEVLLLEVLLLEVIREGIEGDCRGAVGGFRAVGAERGCAVAAGLRGRGGEVVILRKIIVFIGEGIEADGLGGVGGSFGLNGFRLHRFRLRSLVLFGREVVELILAEAVRH